MARCAVPARVVAGGMKYSSDTAIRKSCAAARGADIARDVPTMLNAYKGSNLMALIQILLIEFNSCVAPRHLGE
jgi:hypothetical protein